MTYVCIIGQWFLSYFFGLLREILEKVVKPDDRVSYSTTIEWLKTVVPFISKEYNNEYTLRKTLSQRIVISGCLFFLCLDDY